MTFDEDATSKVRKGTNTTGAEHHREDRQGEHMWNSIFHMEYGGPGAVGSWSSSGTAALLVRGGACRVGQGRPLRDP